MSRAFVSENDGWTFCTKYQVECMSASMDGSCLSSYCSQFPEEERREAEAARKAAAEREKK